MPLPETSDVGKIMTKIKEHHPGWPLKQKRAVALSQAKKFGADIVAKAVNQESKKS